MSNNMNRANIKTFIPLRNLAHRLGLPAAWLKREAESGRIPSLRVNHRLMFNQKTVEEFLMDYAARMAIYSRQQYMKAKEHKK